MRKAIFLSLAILTFAIIAISLPLKAQQFSPTQIRWYSGAGAPPTALPCNSTRNAATYLDTSENLLYACNGISDAWQFMGPSGTAYQVVQNPLGSAFAQEANLAFTSRFTVTDVPAGQATQVDLAQSGATAGTYSCATATVDSYGRVTNISSGGCATSFYQTVENPAGTAFTQEAKLAFSSRFAVTDAPASQATQVELANSGATAGTYTCATATVDTYGRVTSISSGGCGSTPTIQSVILSGGCTTGTNTYDSCTNSLSFPAAFVDNSYSLQCFAGGASNPRASLQGFIKNIDHRSFTVTTVTEGSVAVSFGEIDCTGTHP